MCSRQKQSMQYLIQLLNQQVQELETKSQMLDEINKAIEESKDQGPLKMLAKSKMEEAIKSKLEKELKYAQSQI